VAINDDKRINMCAKLAGGILAHGKVYFKCRYENKARHIDAFLVGSGLHTGGPIVKKVNFKQNFRPKKCASIPPIFLGCHFSKKIPQKKSKRSSMLKIWYKHPWSDPNDCTKIGNDRIWITRVIQKFAGEKQKARKLYFDVFFFVFREIGVASAFHAGPKLFYFWEVGYWGFLRPFSKFRNLA